MIYKRCGYCGKRIETGQRCSCIQRRRMRNDKRTDGVRKLYETTRWKKLRAVCLNRYDNIDIYALFHDGRIIPADTVHHIETALDHPELFFDSSNHIPVGDGSHHEIHKRYKTENPEKVKEELRKYLRLYRETGAAKIV